MKNSIMVLLLLTAFIPALAQEFPMNDKGQIVYEEVVNVDGATKDQVYRQARSWFRDTYSKDAQDNDVVYLSDSYLGEIAANPYLWMEVDAVGQDLNAGAVLYEIMVSVKDGKYRYKVYSFVHESQRSRLGSGGSLENKEPECGVINMQQKYWDDIKKQTHEEIQKLVEALKAHMKNAAANKEGEDW